MFSSHCHKAIPCSEILISDGPWGNLSIILCPPTPRHQLVQLQNCDAEIIFSTIVQNIRIVYSCTLLPIFLPFSYLIHFIFCILEVTFFSSWERYSAFFQLPCVCLLNIWDSITSAMELIYQLLFPYNQKFQFKNFSLLKYYLNGKILFISKIKKLQFCILEICLIVHQYKQGRT